MLVTARTKQNTDALADPAGEESVEERINTVVELQQVADRGLDQVPRGVDLVLREEAEDLPGHVEDEEEEDDDHNQPFHPLHVRLLELGLLQSEDLDPVKDGDGQKRKEVGEEDVHEGRIVPPVDLQDAHPKRHDPDQDQYDDNVALSQEAVGPKRQGDDDESDY